MNQKYEERDIYLLTLFVKQNGFDDISKSQLSIEMLHGKVTYDSLQGSSQQIGFCVLL